MDYQLYWTEQIEYKFLSLFHQRYNKIIDKPHKLTLAPMFGYFLAYPIAWLLSSLVPCLAISSLPPCLATLGRLSGSMYSWGNSWNTS